MPEHDPFQEANRQLTICNACRYCEGYCAVFPAIELRKDFAKGDILYLANLCHDCRACYHACMYSPPHEFAINIPQIMSDVRLASYRHWSWPNWLADCFTNRRFSVAMVFITALVTILAAILVTPTKIFISHRGPGAFYRVIPYFVMVISGVALFLYAIIIWLAGSVRSWREFRSALPHHRGVSTFFRALGDVLAVRNLQGGGPGCSYPDEKPSSVRRFYHSCVYWGFLCAFISTVLAAIYQDVFGWLPPYSITSAPVVFGSLGGVAMIIGTTGLIWIKTKSDPAPNGTGMATLDFIFLALLGLVSLTGMLTLALRNTQAMGSLLIIHLGLVAALFATAPYGKFVHFLYRSLALIKYRIEQNQPR